MPDHKYKTPNGRIISEKDLREKYGTKFDSLVSANTFSIVEENVYKTPNGKFELESVLKDKYGEKFKSLIDNNTFQLDTPVKKKEEPTPGIATRTASELGLETQEPTPQNGSLDGSEVDAVPEKTEETQIIDSVDKLPQEDNEQGFWGNKWRELKTGSTRLGESIASYPEAIYRLGAIPQNLIADFFDIKGLKASPEKFKQTFDIENPVLDYYSKETEKLSEKTDDYYRRKFGTDKQGNTKRSAWDSFFEEGEYAQGFELLGGGIAESTATSLALMAGGAGMSALKLTAAATPAFIEGNVKQLKEEDPQAFLEMAESEITAKAFGMAAAETAFMSVGTGTLGKVYKDVILKEGAQKGAVIFKQGVIKMYETAFKKIGAPISAVGEGIEEMATTVTQNMIMGKDPNENVGESFLQGIGGGVMYGAPMTIIQAKEVVQNTIKKRNLNKEISSSKYIDLKQAFSLENSEEIDDVQISIASKSYSRDILQKELKKEVDAGLITQEESEQSMQVFDKTKQAIDAVEGIELTDKQKIKAVNLIKKKAQLTEKVKDKDPNLVSKELNEIKQIDEQLSKVRDENFLDLIPEEELQTLKDKAQRELMSEKEAEGVKDYKITEEEITERAIQIFESTDAKTKTNENQEENNQENSTQEEIVQQDEQEEVLEDDLGQQNTLAESVDEDAIYVKDGKRGKLVRQGDVISFETENEVIDIENNVENLDKPLSEFGINLENEVEVSIDENNNVTVNGQTYINNYSDPNSAISQNEKGEYTVSLETNKGEKRTFRGRRADQIVYQTKLKEYYDKSTPEQQAEAEKLADEAIVSRENKQAADKGKNKNPRQSEQEYLDSAKAERKAKLAKAESTPKPTISQQTQQFADEVSDTQEDLSEVSAGALQVTVGDSNIILNDKGDNIVIESVNTPKGKRGKGNARKALQKAVEVADKQNKTLELDVKPLGNTTTKKGLTSLYESLGFKADPNQKGKMIRNPNQKTPTKKDEAKTPTKKETKPKVAKAASKPKKTKPTLKPNQVKRIKTKGVKGEFDVEIDIDGYVVKITSVKDGREVSKFTKPSKVKGKKTKPRLNANYSRIEKEALGQKTPNQIKQEQNKKINDAVTSFIPTNEYQAALEYVALGGNMSLASAMKMTLYSAKEVRWITGFKPDSELITLEQVAEDIAAEQEKEGVAGYEESKVISGLQDILQENTSVTQVREKVLEIQSKIDEVNAGGQSINEQQIAAFINNLTPQEFAQFEAIKAEDEFLSELSDKEAIEYYNEQAKNYEKGNEATIQGQENEGKSTTDNKGDEVIGQNDDGQQIKEQSDDEILNYLNEAAKKLGDFGKQNIGINLPVVIAQGVVQTVRIAYKAGKSGVIVIREAIEYIKNTDWYKSLSKKEQKKIGSSTVMEAFNQTESTDKESFQDLEQSFKNQDEKIKNKESFKKKKQRAERLLIQKITDRQFIAKKLVDEAGAQETKDAMVSSHGSSGRAKRIYEKAYQDIYTDKISFKENGKIKFRYQPINSQDRSFLDKMIVLKRIIAIDKNREEKNLPAIKHPGDTNGVAAQKYLNHLKEKIGKKRYKELEVRTKTYFDVFKKVLFEMKENGLISEKAYDSMNGLNYQPRLFLQHVTDFEGNVSLGAASNQNSDKGGLSGNQIKEIKEGSTDAIIRDSQWLLATTIASREKAMAMNTVNSIFMTKEFPAAQKRFKNLKANIKNKKNWSKEDKRFYEYFSELNKKVIDNPIISEQKNSKQLVIEGMEPEITYKRKFSEVPANFDKAFYYVNGVKQEFFLEKKLHESWFDNVTGFLNPQTKEIFGLASGSYLLKAIATGINASFSIVNTPRDFAFMTVFSDQYSSVHLVASIQVASDTFKAINAIRKSTGNISRDGNSLEKYIYYGGDMAWLSTQGMLKKESMLGQGLQNMFSGRGGERTKNIAKKIFNSATLKSINTYSELMFRVALFERTVYNELKKLGYKDINEVNDLLDESTGEVIETKKQRTDALYRRGVAEARSLLDFNQGGAITKDLEAFIPYINTAVQGTRVGADATKKNPVKVISKILQSSAAVGAIAIGYSLLKFRLNKDEDEERNSAEIYLDAYEGVSQYQKQQYSIVFDGTKDEEGNYNYTKIAKNQQLAPFLNLFDNVYQQYLRKMVGRKAKDSKVIYNEAWTTIQNNIIPIDITSPITGNLTKNPAAKAALTYTTGYDFYRDQPLTFDQNLDNNVMAGAKDSNIEDFYKKFAREFRLTPANLKGSVESLITTPNTNYLVGVLYGGLDASVAEDKDMDKIAKDMYKDVKSSVQGRYKGKTSNFNKIVNNQRPIEAELKEIKTKNDYREVDVEKVAKDFFNDKLSVPDFLDKMKDYSPKEYKKVESKIKSMAKYGNLDRFVIGLAFETDKEARALKMVQYYGDLFDDENLESVKQMEDLGVLDKETLTEYQKLKDKLSSK